MTEYNFFVILSFFHILKKGLEMGNQEVKLPIKKTYAQTNIFYLFENVRERKI